MVAAAILLGPVPIPAVVVVVVSLLVVMAMKVVPVIGRVVHLPVLLDHPATPAAAVRPGLSTEAGGLQVCGGQHRAITVGP
ncbi:MAG TPA: hypothetical protein VGH89_34815, partial [Pseudonocardia sp.]